MSKLDLLETSVRRIDPCVADAAVALVLAAIVAAGQLSGRDASVVVPAGLVLSATVAFRRRAPVVAALVAGAASTGIAHAGVGALAVVPVAMVLDYYLVGRRPARHGSRWVDAGLLLIPVLGIVSDPNTPSPGNPLVVDALFVWAFFIAMPFAAGRAVRGRMTLNAALRASVRQLEEHQREQARQAVVQERTRIARELHDVLAHSVSVMVIQTEAARAVAPRDRAAAIAALHSVESCGREALADMRGMIGVLHRADIEVLGGAAPGLSQLDRLAERARASGLPVEVIVRGEPRRLPPALDLVSFRVVQEALTNAIKHAGPARALVRVTFTADALELEVVDTGRGSAHEPRSTGVPGHGLLGMHERLSLYGGGLKIGQRRGGGFRVLARIPLTDAVTV